jgi:arsenate reductase
VTAPGELVLLHDPRCSKSRAARALLEERGVAFRERRHLEEPLSRDELAELARKLGRRPREWLRRGEEAWRASGLGEDAPDDAILAAMARDPILIERPILIGPRRAVVGRPPEAILALFG